MGTNVISEAKAQKSKGPYVKETGDMNNGGINLLEYIMHDSLGLYNVEERDKYLPNVNNQSINMDNNIRIIWRKKYSSIMLCLIKYKIIFLL